jgi:hypothetical protein
MDLVMSTGLKSFVNYFTTKKKEKLDYILEPFQAMVQLALLGYSPVGSKLTIQDNILCIQQPGISQGVIRYFNDDNKDDLYYLFNVFRRFINYYNWMISHSQYYKLYLLLLKMTIQGLDNLIQTYSNTDKISVLHTLQMYKTILIKNYKLSLESVGRNKKLLNTGELSGVYKRQRTISNQSTQSTQSNQSTKSNTSNNSIQNNLQTHNNKNLNQNQRDTQTGLVNKIKSNDSFNNLLKRIDSNNSLIGKYSNTFKDNNTLLSDIENELLEATIVDTKKKTEIKSVINDDGEVSSLDSEDYNDYLELKLPSNKNTTDENVINYQLNNFNNELDDIRNLNNQNQNNQNNINNKININNNKINIDNNKINIDNNNIIQDINSNTINLDFNDFNKKEDNIDTIFNSIVNIYNDEEYIIIYNTLILLDKYKSNYNNYIYGLEYTLKNTNMKIKKWINDNVGL